MASIRYEKVIEAAPDTVFGVVTKPESIPEWFPGIVKAEVDGNVRTITTASGMQMPELIIANDPLLRRFAYRITAPLYKFHLGTIDVIELAPNRSLCIYSTTAEPDTLALIIAGGTLGALEEICRIAEDRQRSL